MGVIFENSEIEKRTDSVHGENMIWHWSFLLCAWIVKEKWGLGEKGDVKVGKKDNNGRKYMENRAMGNLLFLVFSI